MRITITLVFAIWFAIAACGERAAAQSREFGGPTMGTAYRVRLNAPRPAAQMTRLQGDIESLLAEIDRQMSTYRLDSELSRFNRASANEWFPIPSDTAVVVAAAQKISKATGGALDVTVQPLVRLWHFGSDGRANADGSSGFEPPSNDAIANALSSVGFERLDVRLRPPALRKEVDRLEVDLSSITPGYAVDQMAAILTEHGITDFTIELGGEVRSQGRRADGKPWRVAIERPLANRREMLRAVPLENAAISTAGDYRKFYEAGGRRFSHIIDPSSGRPVEHSLASVTVLADTCLEADGWDTPLLVLGPERGYQCAQENDIAALFVSYEDGNEIVRATTAWIGRLGIRNRQ